MNSSRTHSAPSLRGKSLTNSQADLVSDLFSLSTAPLPGSLDLDHVVRSIVTEVLRAGNKSREEVAEEMQTLLGRPVTARMLYNFTSDTKELHRFPLAWIAAFCHVTGDARLVDAVLQCSGLRVMTPRQARLVELAERRLDALAANTQVDLLEQQMLAERDQQGGLR